MPMDELLDIMKRLRASCPWDKKQTRESLKPYLVEETYEVVEALEESEPEKIKEELGDLLFQIVFHAEISRERGEFDFEDVARAIGEKMRARHPHVFGEKTFGLGAEPSLFELENGSALLLSSALWETPDGTSWHESGIEPDEEIKGEGDDYAEVAADQLERVLKRMADGEPVAAEPEREAA